MTETSVAKAIKMRLDILSPQADRWGECCTLKALACDLATESKTPLRFLRLAGITTYWGAEEVSRILAVLSEGAR
jgi:hypothetical protein